MMGCNLIGKLLGITTRKAEVNHTGNATIHQGDNSGNQVTNIIFATGKPAPVQVGGVAPSQKNEATQRLKEALSKAIIQATDGILDRPDKGNIQMQVTKAVTAGAEFIMQQIPLNPMQLEVPQWGDDDTETR